MKDEDRQGQAQCGATQQAMGNWATDSNEDIARHHSKGPKKGNSSGTETI